MSEPVGGEVDMAGLPEGVSASFAHPCLECGRTVLVVRSVEQPHDCQPVDVQGALARAWWAGYEYAKGAGRE